MYFQHDLSTPQLEIIKIQDSTKSSKSLNENSSQQLQNQQPHPSGVRKKEKVKKEKNKHNCLICNSSFQDKTELDVSTFSHFASFSLIVNHCFSKN